MAVRKNIIDKDTWWWENDQGIEVVTRHTENDAEYGEVDCHLITKISWSELLEALGRSGPRALKASIAEQGITNEESS